MLRAVLFQGSRHLHTSSASQAGSRWRIQQGLSKHAHRFNEMSQLPDWSYVDGTPAPLSNYVKKEQNFNEEFTRKALALMAEMTDARQLHEDKGIKDEEERQRLIDSKLKPKAFDHEFKRAKYKNYKL